LERWIANHRGKPLWTFKATHVLSNLPRGLEHVNALCEYHSYFHSTNILVHPVGIILSLMHINLYVWCKTAKWKQQHDIVDSIRVFLECMGGRAHYTALPREIRYICANLRYNTILKRFPSMTALRRHLELFEWPGVE